MGARLEFNVAWGGVLGLQVGDITKIPADAIGNAANSGLTGGGGVDGAIHRAGGPDIMRELDEIRKERGGCAPGGAVSTGAGQLPARWVLHAVGPVYRDGSHGEAETLRSTYREIFFLASRLKARSLTLPAISTGAYGFPMEEAAEIGASTLAFWFQEFPTSLRKIHLVLFGYEAYEVFARTWLKTFRGYVHDFDNSKWPS